MAIFNEILAGRYNRALQKLLAIKGSPPVRQIAGEIFAALNMFYGVENRFVETWQRYGAGFAAGPVVAQACNFRMRNPAGSNVIAVLEKLTISSTANDQFAFGRQAGAGTLPTTDLTASQQGFEIDLRQGPFVQQNSVLRVSRDTGQSAPNNLWVLPQALANTTLDLILFEDHEISIAPGDVIEVASTTVNAKCFFGLIWRERALEESERQ